MPLPINKFLRSRVFIRHILNVKWLIDISPNIQSLVEVVGYPLTDFQNSHFLPQAPLPIPIQDRWKGTGGNNLRDNGGCQVETSLVRTVEVRGHEDDLTRFVLF